MTYIIISAIWTALLSVLMLLLSKKMKDHHKSLFFYLICIPIVLASLYLAGHTVYENIISETKGPVHWHADYQVWVCGERLDMINPRGLNNKIGTPLLHEHNDDRIHVEGAVMRLEDVRLGEYFSVIGGSLESDSLSYPVQNGLVSVSNGDVCPESGPGTLKVYVNGNLTPYPEQYVLSPHINVPPGDCIIVDFSPGSPGHTDKVCESWAAHDKGYEDTLIGRPE